MLRCNEVVRLLSSSDDNPTSSLNWPKRLELKLHLMMCKHCASYAAHLSILSNAISTLLRKKTSEEAERIRELENETIKKVQSKKV